MTPEEIVKTIEKELVSWRHDHFKGMRDGDHSGEYLERGSQIELANYFYDLGCRHTAVMYDDIEFERQAREARENMGNFPETSPNFPSSS